MSPAATELCDAVDNDCDGATDEIDAADAQTWYQDLDADGYGNASNQTLGCAQPTGYVEDATDCDDTSATTNTAGTELCDLVDNDCDGTVDEDDAADAPTWYQDSDADGYGSGTVSVTACSTPNGYSSLNTDCDDAASDVNPTAGEVVDGVDNDCDGAGYHGDFLASGSTSLTAGDWEYSSFTVSSGVTVTVTGGDALQVWVLGAVQIDGTVDLSGADGESIRAWSSGAPVGGAGGGGGGGAGGDGDDYEGSGPVTAPSGSGASPGLGGISYSSGSGGGGGGQAVAGDDGTSSGGSYSAYAGGAGGTAVSNTSTPTLTAGSGGGGGGWGSGYNSSGGAGGGGGGAWYLEADSIQVAGTILCGGGNGGGNTSSSCYHGGGGGAGSGGTLWLVADSLEVSGTLYCDGGAGGVPDYCGHGGIAGTGGNGADGVIWLDSASLSVPGTVSPGHYTP